MVIDFTKLPVKLKHCPKCDQDLLVSNFTSTKAKYCKNCHILHRTDQKIAMMQRSLMRTRLRKQAFRHIQSIAELKKSLQKLVNKYVRLRDAHLMCISCGKQCGAWEAGHFWAQGSSGVLRYNLDNIHKQGTGCNKFKHGNLLLYREGLIKKIGQERVDWLDQHHNDVKHWTREELEEKITEFKQLIKEIEPQQEYN